MSNNINTNSKYLAWSRMRTKYLLLCLVFYGLTELGRVVYRPFIYQHHIRDYGIADTIGNHFGAVALIFAILTIQHSTLLEGWIVISVVTFGYIAYEIAQQFIPGSVFDSGDIVASVIGGILASGLFWWLYSGRINDMMRKVFLRQGNREL